MLRNMRSVLTIEPETHDRLKAIAKSNGMTLKQAVSAIFNFTLPRVEAGELKITTQEPRIEEAQPEEATR